MSTAANLHGRPIHDGSVPEVLFVGLDLSIGSADDGDERINLGRGFGRGRHAPHGPRTPSLPRREREAVQAVSTRRRMPLREDRPRPAAHRSADAE